MVPSNSERLSTQKKNKMYDRGKYKLDFNWEEGIRKEEKTS